MDTHADSLGVNLDRPMDEVGKAVKKGQNWFSNETTNLENLVSQGDQDAKNKLLQLAQKYHVPTTEQMGIGEIKNKIKAKLRDMK